jgi:uncharacterized protein
MARLLLWVVLGFVAWMLLRPKRRAVPPAEARRSPPTANAGNAAEAMVDCAACGLHFPASEAIRDGARPYCCTAHRDSGPRRAE